MGSENIFCVVLFANLFEKSVAFDARRLLDSLFHRLRHVGYIFFRTRKNNMIFPAKSLEKFLIPFAFHSPEAVVEVSDDEALIRMGFHNFRKEIHTIGTSGTGDYKNIAWGQLIFLEEIFEHSFLFFKRHPFFIELSDKVEETIIGSDFVEHCFFTLYTLVLYHISFIFPIIYIYGLHFPVTVGCSISRIYIIYMFGTETKRTVVTCRPFRMDSNGFMTIVTLKRLIMHYKNHILGLGIIIKMACKFPKKTYELGFIKWVFLHKTSERFGRIVERYVVVSFPNHDIKKSSVLIPGKDSFAISERIFFHDTI